MRRILIWGIMLALTLGILADAHAQSDYRIRDGLVVRSFEGRGGVPLWWDGFFYGRYAGTTRDCLFYDYTGSGHYIVRLQGDSANVFTIDKAGNVWSAGTIAGALGITLPDTDASNNLSLIWNENDATDRTLNLLVSGANRSLTIEANSQLNQDLTTDSTPTFGGLTINGDAVIQSAVDSTTAVQILDSDGGTPIFNVDTINERVGIGTASPTNEVHLYKANANILLRIEQTGVGNYLSGFYASTDDSDIVFAAHDDTYSTVPEYAGKAVFQAGSGALVLSAWNDKIQMYTGGRLAGNKRLTITSAGNVGINTTGPDRKLDVLDASNPQRRDTHTDGTIFTDFQTDGNGDYSILPTGDKITLSAGTKHDGFVIRNPAELQTGNAVQQTLDNVTLLDENTYHVEAWIVAVQSDGTDRASYHIAATVYRTAAGGATLQGGVTSLHTQESNGALDATFTVNANDIRVSVTGIAAETWEWGTTLRSINMSN